MALGLIVAVAFTGFLIYSLMQPQVPATDSGISRSPLHQAEKALDARYARGEITAEEYRRVLTILRH